MSSEVEQARPGFPKTREALLKHAERVKVRAKKRAAVVAPLVERFGKRDRATCSTPVGTMRVRALLAETSTKIKGAAKPQVRGR